MTPSDTASWYATLIQPAFAPPAWVFGPVWSVLYLVIAVSFGHVVYRALKRRLPLAVLVPFGLNVVFNLAFTPIQFGLKNNVLAAVDILLVLGTLVWALRAIWPHVRWVTWVNLPYLAGACFATVLRPSSSWLNR